MVCGHVSAAGVAAAGTAAAPPLAARSASRQPGARLGAFWRRHASAAPPPGDTPAHSASKSARHDWRIAAACASVGCCAAAGTASAVSASSAPAQSRCRRGAKAVASSMGTPVSQKKKPGVHRRVATRAGSLRARPGPRRQNMCWPPLIAMLAPVTNAASWLDR